MRRKALQDVANTLCQMLVGWRMSDDLEKLADLPDGTIEIDVLEGRASHNVVGELDLCISRELSAWFQARLVALSIPIADVLAAVLQSQFKTDRIATNRKKIVSFDWSCEACLRTSEKEYRGTLVERHTWHRRVSI